MALVTTSVKRDGSLMAYTLSGSGSDRQEIFVRDVATGKDLGDHLRWVKFTRLAWTRQEGLLLHPLPRAGDRAPRG